MNWWPAAASAAEGPTICSATTGARRATSSSSRVVSAPARAGIPAASAGLRSACAARARHRPEIADGAHSRRRDGRSASLTAVTSGIQLRRERPSSGKSRAAPVDLDPVPTCAAASVEASERPTNHGGRRNQCRRSTSAPMAGSTTLRKSTDTAWQNPTATTPEPPRIPLGSAIVTDRRLDPFHPRRQPGRRVEQSSSRGGPD